MRHPRLLGALVLGMLLCLAGPAAGQDYEAAGRHFAAAQDAFAQGAYKKAAESFQAAYDITKDPVLLFNIGESWQRAGDGARAVASYRAYLLAQPGAKDRPEVERRLKDLEGETPPPASGEPQRPAAKEAVKVPDSQTPSEELLKVRPTSRLRTAAWAAVASAVAVVTAGAVLGLGAQNRSDELTRRTTLVMGGQPLEYGTSEREAYTSLMSEGRAYDAAAIACFAVAGAAALTAGALFLIDWRHGRAGTPGKLERALAPRGAGRALAWSF